MFTYNSQKYHIAVGDVDVFFFKAWYFYSISNHNVIIHSTHIATELGQRFALRIIKHVKFFINLSIKGQ